MNTTPKLTSRQIVVLLYLREQNRGEPVSIPVLARFLHLPPHGVSRTLASLVRHGLVERIPTPSGRVFYRSVPRKGEVDR